MFSCHLDGTVLRAGHVLAVTCALPLGQKYMWLAAIYAGNAR
jgi:hypothetical protein